MRVGTRWHSLAQIAATNNPRAMRHPPSSILEAIAGADAHQLLDLHRTKIPRLQDITENQRDDLKIAAGQRAWQLAGKLPVATVGRDSVEP